MPRIVLISDGNENLGSVVRAAWQARQLGIPVDTYSLGGRPKPNLRLESMSLPTQVFSGEPFPIDISLRSPQRSTAVVEIYSDPQTWTLLGYEGPSFAQGGYVGRGFDDLDWLPDPEQEA